MNNLYRANYNYIENRSSEKKEIKKPKKNKFDFKKCKNNTICSLNEVEHFLNNFSDFYRYIKLYKILK